MNVLKINFAAGDNVFDEAYYRMELLQRAATNDSGFLLMFSEKTWHDVYEIRCTQGTARGILAQIIAGGLTSIQVAGDILSITLKPDSGEFYRQRHPTPASLR